MLMIAGTLPRSIKARERAAIICARNGVSAIGGDEPDELAAMGEKPAREVVDLVAEGVRGLLHPRQRRRRDAGAGRKGARDGGSGNAGALGDVLRAHEPARHCSLLSAHPPRPHQAGHCSKALHNRVAQLCND